MYTLLKTSDIVGRIVNFRKQMLDRDIIDTWQLLSSQLRHSLPQLDRCERIQCSNNCVTKTYPDCFKCIKNILTVASSDRTCKIPMIDIVSYQTIDHLCV